MRGRSLDVERFRDYLRFEALKEIVVIDMIVVVMFVVWLVLQMAQPHAHTIPQRLRLLYAESLLHRCSQTHRKDYNFIAVSMKELID